MRLVLFSLFTLLSTTIDDFIVLTVLFVSYQKEKWKITLGQVAGILLTVLISIIIASGGKAVLSAYIRYFGLIPLFMGIRLFFSQEEEKSTEMKNFSLLAMISIAIGNGGDNIAIYVPFFMQYGMIQTCIITVIFVMGTLLECVLASRIGNQQILNQQIKKYQRYLVPLVLCALGISILLG